MLQKTKHIISTILVILFVYPIAFQSIHVFEHKHEHICCSHCTVQANEPIKEMPDDPSASALCYLSEKEDPCAVCNFNYAKLQIDAIRGINKVPDSFAVRYDVLCNMPYILFQGFIFSLRAPPTT